MQPDNKQPGFWHPSADLGPTYAPNTLGEIPKAQLEERVTHDEPLIWQASESVHEEKQMAWFLSIAGVTVLLVIVSLFLIKSLTFAILVVVMALSLIIMSRRPPKVLTYHLGPNGLQIEQKVFQYHDFRAFGVTQEGALFSVVLIPNKRFVPNVNIYFPPESGEHIVDVLGSVLPMEHVEPDVLDKIIRQLHL